MSHEIETNAYRGATPWHGLGIRLDDDASLDAWIEAAGFTYEIHEATAAFQPLRSEYYRPFDGRKILYRGDTLEPLSIVSDGYKVVQPREVMEFFRDLTNDMGYRMDSAAILRQGKIYFALAQTGNETEIAGSRHKQYVLLATGCDGTLATTAELTDIRVVCMNTLRAATNAQNEDRIKVKHSTTFDATNAKQRLGLLSVDESFREMTDALATLADVRVSYEQSREFFVRLLSPDRADEILNAKEGDKVRAVRGLADLEKSYLMAPGAVPGTLYGVLQGVTHFVDHVRGGDNRDNAQYSALFTQGARLKEKAFNELLAMAA